MDYDKNEGYYSIESHDIVLWAGDFNSRTCYPFETTVDLLKKNRYLDLATSDWLNINKPECFPGFNERIFDYLPTFKFKKDTKK